MAALTNETEQLVRTTLRAAGLPPHIIERNIREYREGDEHVQELRAHLSLMASPDPSFVLARALMDELKGLPRECRLTKIGIVSMMLSVISDQP